MGSAASVAQSSRGAIAGSSQLSRWQTRHLESELFGVVRHAERADDIFAFHKGKRWSDSQDGRMWPLDPPLSDTGLDKAEDLARDIQEFAAHRGSEFHVVISSPYFRCVQTAALVCKRLGPSVRLLVDHSLGEVHGPEVMGLNRPHAPVRPAAVGRDYCRSLGVRCESQAIGQRPEWPEKVQDARQRFALRFLSHLKRAAKGRRNFLLVTHADCVGAALKLIPDTSDNLVQRVDPGAAILASRSSRLVQKPATKFATVVPDVAEEPDTEILEWNSECMESSQRDWTEQQGWKCQTLNLSMVKKKTSGSKVAKRFAFIAARGSLSQQKIQRLLGEMKRDSLTMSATSPQPQQATAESIGNASNTPNSPTSTLSSNVSFSTMMFAASDLNNSCSDDRSPLRCQSQPWFHADSGNMSSPGLPSSSVSDNNFRSRRSRSPNVSLNVSRIRTGELRNEAAKHNVSVKSQAAEELAQAVEAAFPKADAEGAPPKGYDADVTSDIPLKGGAALFTRRDLLPQISLSASDANSQRSQCRTDLSEADVFQVPSAPLTPLSQVETSSLLQRRRLARSMFSTN